MSLKGNFSAFPVPPHAGFPPPVAERDARRGGGVAPGGRPEPPGHRAGDGAGRVAGRVVRQLVGRAPGGEARHSQRGLQPPPHEGH